MADAPGPPPPLPLRLQVVQGLLDPHLAVPSGLDVLDVGGGTGGFAVPLARRGHRVVVVDRSLDALAALQRRADEAGVEVRGVQGDADDLLAAVDAGVDVLLCHGVLEDAADAAAVLRAVAAVLRPGGLVSLLVANGAARVLAAAVAGRPAEALRLLAALPGGADGPASRPDVGGPPGSSWTPASLRAAVQDVGLHVEEVHGVRAVADLVPPALQDGAPELLSLETALASRHPFCDLATEVHLLARRGGERPG